MRRHVISARSDAENPPDSVIFTDSLFMLMALKSNDWNDFHRKVALVWVPSHCNIPGNEKADHLTNLGTELSQHGIRKDYAGEDKKNEVEDRT